MFVEWESYWSPSCLSLSRAFPAVTRERDREREKEWPNLLVLFCFSSAVRVSWRGMCSSKAASLLTPADKLRLSASVRIYCNQTLRCPLRHLVVHLPHHPTACYFNNAMRYCVLYIGMISVSNTAFWGEKITWITWDKSALNSWPQF